MDAGPQPPTPVERYLRRRAIQRRLVLIASTAILSIALVANVWTQVRGGSDWGRFDRQAFVVQSVMAGDELAIEPLGGGSPTIVKLLGVDCHGVIAGAATQPHHAMDAYRAARELAQGRRVVVTLPPLTPRTPDGRLHAYVYLEGDPPSLSLNERLIAAGHVYSDRRREHPFHKQFNQAEQEARLKSRGLWATVRDEDQPAWRQQWIQSLRLPDERPD